MKQRFSPLIRRAVFVFAVLVSALTSGAFGDNASSQGVDVAADREQFREQYIDRFPDVDVDDFVYGVYAIDPALRAQWEEINAFPPYEFAVDEGRELAEQPLPDGTQLIDCLGSDPVSRHPYFDAAAQEIITLEAAINRCRRRHGAEPLSYRKQPLAKIFAYMSMLERGGRRATPEPDSPAAFAAYEAGKAYFHTKRGQLNLACADCHVRAAGQHLREQTLAPLLGVVNHYPLWVLRRDALGTLHQRFVGCVEQVRGEADFLQSRRYRELEYFLSLMSNGLPLVGPGTHR